MKIEGKKIEFYYLYGTDNKQEKKSRIMEYRKINDIDFGFYESKNNKVFHAIHLDSGLSVVELESKGYKQETGFSVLAEKVRKIPKTKFEKILPKTKKRVEAWGFDFPLNG